MARVAGSYPTNRVIWQYTLLGGTVIALISKVFWLMMVWIVVLSPRKRAIDFPLSELFGTAQLDIIGFDFVSIISEILFFTAISFIPFFAIGYYLAVKKFGIAEWLDYGKVFGIGFIITGLYAIFDLFIFNLRLGEIWLEMLIIVVLAGLLGGLSSVILGKFVLPKITKKRA